MIQCQADRCRTYTSTTESDARALGWMLWAGKTQGGKDSRVSFCPVHAGRTEEAAEAQETGFDAECFTCMARASEEWADDFTGTEADAEEWMEEHACEPETRLVRPKATEAAA